MGSRNRSEGDMIMEIAAISFLCLALGLVIGYEWGERRKKKSEPEAYVPEYDYYNPINQRQERTVTECGREWTVYGGQR